MSETKNIRILLHLFFWIAYTTAYAILNMSFSSNLPATEYSTGARFFYFWSAELWMLPVKLIVTYGFLYYLIPKFFKTGKYWGLFWRVLLFLVPLLLVNRLIVYYQVYPLLFDEFPNLELLSPRRIFFSLLEIASAVAVASTVKLLRDQVQSQQREAMLLQEKLQSELNFLKAQTNPHFLFNTLNNIYALARKQSPNTAPIVLKLSQIIRFMLYECTSPRIALAEELKVVRDYIDLENLRYNNRLSVSFSEDLDYPQQQIAPLLLLPFVENAFKHGASETRFESFIRINIELKEGILKARIENSKEEDQITEPGGIGLKNVKRQLELIYPGKHQLEIKNKETLFTVNLQINLNQEI